MAAWVSRLRAGLGKLRRRRCLEAGESVGELPQDWRHTLVTSSQPIKRSSSSASSITSSASSASTSTTSSSYSVTDFLRDLACSECEGSIALEASNTSTPFSCDTVPMNRMRRSGLKTSRMLDDTSGVTIYEDDDRKVELDKKPNRSLTFQPMAQSADGNDYGNEYENGEFLKPFTDELQDAWNEEDLDDGYEIIIVNNNSKNRKNNFRTLKCNKRE